MAVRRRPCSLRGGGRVKAPSFAALTLSPCETWDGQRKGVGVEEAIPPRSCESRKRKRKMTTKPNRARARARARIKPRLGRSARWPRVGWRAAASPIVAFRFRPRSFLDLLLSHSAPSGEKRLLDQRRQVPAARRKLVGVAPSLSFSPPLSPPLPSSFLSDAPKRHAELSCSSETCNVILVTLA
jgi:hypothetical protein